MNAVATLIARSLWAGMLWFMRRTWMRRLQRGSVKFFKEGPARDRAWENFRKQERFARKYGLRILTFVILCCLYAIVFTFVYAFLSYAIDQGWLPVRTQETPTNE